MKKTFITLLALALLLTLSLPAMAEDTKKPGELTITGSYTVILQADTATIEVGARTLDKTVAQAQAKNNAIMDEVIKQLTALGFDKKDIRTTQYYIGFEPDYSFTTYSQQAENGNFSVTNMLGITVKDLSLLPKVIDTASAAGANNAYNLTFSSSKTKEAYQEALKMSVEDATEKAAVLAQAAGRELGEVLTMSATEGYQGYGMDARMMYAEGSAKATPILPGTQSLTASVSITYELK